MGCETLQKMNGVKEKKKSIENELNKKDTKIEEELALKEEKSMGLICRLFNSNHMMRNY